MRYDIPAIHELCLELGLPCATTHGDALEIDLGQGAVLCFQNAAQEEDCAFGFKGTPWHVHDQLMFADAHGFFEVNHVDALRGLKQGEILIAERWLKGKLQERWLVHSKYNDELEYMQPREELRVRRAEPAG